MINEALRLIRVFHNLKQGDLAKELGISQSHLSEIEKGTKQPTFELLQKYSSTFDIPASSIMFFAEKKDDSSVGRLTDAISNKTLQMLNWVDTITSRDKKHSH